MTTMTNGCTKESELNQYPDLPEIPNKLYFRIGEVSDLCQVKAHVLRYWEREFPQLKPMKRRGNRRYYKHKDVLLARQIRALLYGKGYTISGARKYLSNRQTSIEVVEPSLPQEHTTVRNEDKPVTQASRKRGLNVIINELEGLLALLQ